MNRNPTRVDLGIFQAKATVYRAIRFCRDLGSGLRDHPRTTSNGAGPPPSLLAESRSALWDSTAPHAEQVLQAGKVQNLRAAGRLLDGVSIPAGETFSFWRQLGAPSRRRGYVRGRELRQGCLIPTVGGGLCQLSNALYDCALHAGFHIEERHPHTQVVPGSLAESGRDATVFWNYVDLRFRSARDFRLRVDLTSEELIVRFEAAQ
jgi:vancomycin resistance protein YoaR